MNVISKFALCLIAGALLAAAPTPGHAAMLDDDQYDVPYVPTPMKTVARMLEMAKVKPTDVLYDLGSGDGRIVISAVRDYGASRAVGVDINPVRIRESNENARKARVTDKVKFYEANIFEHDFSEATVLLMYLLTEVNLKLRPKILSTLKPGTRVVTHDFDMGEWEPDDVASMDGFRHVYLWIVPANVDGTWEVTAGGTKYPLVLEQFFQRLSGSVQLGGKSMQFRGGHLDGANVTFEANAVSGNGAKPSIYKARAMGPGVLEGTIDIGGSTVPFTARRTGPSPAIDAPRSK
jgi:precorrin-6B methylase 2